LPAYFAASDDQLARLRERIEGGATAAMLLSEWDSGSNLTAIRTRATTSDGGYLVDGEKQLINAVRRADILVTLVRTSEPGGALGAASGLTLLWIDRDGSVEDTARWGTSAVPAADIGGLRFRDTRVAAANRLGGEGEGFGLVQKALSLSRGGVGAFATGTSNRALGIALAHGRERVLYGVPIMKLEAVAEHLVRMAAFDLATTTLALKTCAAVNAYGPRAAHLTAIAKLACSDLAERAVAEGRAVMGARSLLTALPFQQVARDVVLYGIFDGTRHLMLDQIQWRLKQVAARGDEGEPDTGAAMYRAPIEDMVRLTRRRGRPWLPAPSKVAARLAGDGAFDIGPLIAASAALEQVARSIPPAAWQSQRTSFALGECLAELEAALAVAELADPTRRAGLGARAVEGAEGPLPLAVLAEHAVAMLICRSLDRLRRIVTTCNVAVDLHAVERAATLTESKTGALLCDALRDQSV
jgi:alkylation response protein AidB-like acyl-CoA dehydrogenase